MVAGRGRREQKDVQEGVRERQGLCSPADALGEFFLFFKRVFEEFHTNYNDIPLRQIMELMVSKPDIPEINFFRQQEFLENQKKKTKLILKDK